MGFLGDLFRSACTADTTDEFCVVQGLTSSRFTTEDLKPFKEAAILSIHERMENGDAVTDLEKRFMTGEPNAVESMNRQIRHDVGFVLDKYGMSWDFSNGPDLIPREDALEKYKEVLDQRARDTELDAVLTGFEKKVSGAKLGMGD